MHGLSDRRRVRLGRDVNTWTLGNSRDGWSISCSKVPWWAYTIERVWDGVLAALGAASLTLASIALRLSTMPADDLRAILDALGLRP